MVADLLLYHHESPLAIKSEAKIPRLRLIALRSPEYDRREMLRATLFTDWGVLDPEAFQIDPREVRGTVGLGFGLAFPIPLTLNFGFPVIYQEVDRRQVFSFTIALF